MRSFAIKTVVHLVVALAVAAALMAPAFVFGLFADKPLTWYREKYFWMFLAFGAVLAGCRSFKAVAATLGLLAVLEATQFASLAYTGDYITPYSIGFMFVEMAEVASGAAASFGQLFYIPLIVIVPYAVCLLFLRKTWGMQLKARWFTLLIILFLIFPAIRVRVHSDRKDIVKFFPAAANPTLANTLNSYAVYLAVLLPESVLSEPRQLTFKPYVIHETGPVPDQLTIVLVMGESLTPKHMSLFGYHRETTPFLKSLAGDPSFFFTRGYSAANATRTTMPMFYNVQYHPADEEAIKHQRTNLFRLAKNHGFQTVYISAQKSNILNGVQTSAIDTMITVDDQESFFQEHRDEGLALLADRIALAKRNFIVLHQRNSHAPYAGNYSHRPEFIKYPFESQPFREATINAYDNSVLYSDFVYRRIIGLLREKTSGPVYLFITSDHGEEFGEEAHYGHDRLALPAGDVPILFYGWRLPENPDVIARLAALPVVTHYELGKMIAELFGCRLENPNEEKDIFYINGVASLGRSGYLRCRTGPPGQPPQVEILR